jgi:hypothetical protein
MSDVHGHGTTLTIDGDTVGEITNITGPNRTRGTADATSFDSASATREYVALRYRDEGELTLDLKYNADGATDSARIVRVLYKSGETVSVVITLSNDETFTCDGFVSGVGHTIPLDDKVTQTVSIKLTGQATWA